MTRISTFFLILTIFTTVLSQCPEDCDRCNNSGQCLQCENDKFLDSLGKCSSCPVEDCETCNNVGSCTQCEKGKYLSLDVSLGRCIDCQSGCKTCSSIGRCMSCEWNYRNENGRCARKPFWSNWWFWVAFAICCACCLLLLALAAIAYLIMNYRSNNRRTTTRRYSEFNSFDRSSYVDAPPQTYTTTTRREYAAPVTRVIQQPTTTRVV